MQIIAHRGASAILPENTFAAFDAALEMGAHGLELDIQCSRDGVAMVFHDGALARMCDVAGDISAMTLEQLRELRVEQAHPLPTLAELFARYAGKTTLWLEIKDARCVEELVGLVRSAVASGTARAQQCVIIGFDTAALMRVRASCPEAVIGLSLENLPEADALCALLDSITPAYVVAQYELTDEALVHLLAERGIQLVVWTLNQVQESLRMQSLGVSGIITDVPNILGELFADTAPAATRHG